MSCWAILRLLVELHAQSLEKDLELFAGSPPGEAQRRPSHPPSQPWVVAVGRAVTTEKDEKHIENMDKEE